MFAYPSTPESHGSYELKLLQEIAERLSERAIPHDVLKEVVTFVTSLVWCDSARVYLLENDELVLHSFNSSGEQELNRFPIDAEDDGAAWLMSVREPIAIAEGAYKDVRVKIFTDTTETLFETSMLAPVVGGGEFLGLIHIRSRNRKDFSRREINMIATIGFLLGTKIESARLKRRNAELSERIETRSLVNRAKTIMQHDLGISEQTAYRMMQLESQHRNKRMNEIAEAILLTHEMKQISRAQAPDGNLNSKSACLKLGNGIKLPQSKS